MLLGISSDYLYTHGKQPKLISTKKSDEDEEEPEGAGYRRR